MTEEPEEREWYSLSRKFGIPVADLQRQMTDFEFRRHLEDQKDFPDADGRSAHLLYVLAILLNEFIGGWNNGKRPLTGQQIAPWIKVVDKPRQLELDDAIGMFFPTSRKGKKGGPAARPNVGRKPVEDKQGG